MRYATEKLLQALALGGAGIPVGLAAADLLVGQENGTNSGEIPLNLIMGASPLVAGAAAIGYGERAQEQAVQSLEERRRAQISDYVEHARKLYDPAAARIEAMPISVEEKTQQLKDLYRMVEENLMGRDGYKDAAARIGNAEKEIARMPARRLGLAAALATGLAVPVSMVMANDWGAPSMEAGQ